MKKVFLLVLVLLLCSITIVEAKSSGKGEVFIGGCCIYDDDMPEYHCNNCRRSYSKDLKKYIKEPNNWEDYEEET